MEGCMRAWLYSEALAKIENDLDLEDEDFISSSEMLGYFNEAIDNVEAILHKLYARYFLTTAAISLVEGTQDYSFPSDIYAMKVSKFLYNGTDEKYKIRRMKRIEDILDVQSGDRY